MTEINWQRYLVKPGKSIDLSEWDAAEKASWDGDKGSALEQVTRLNAKLEVQQELLFAEGKHKLLIVLQGMDTSGKDGVIRRVFEGVNPQGRARGCLQGPHPP